MIDCSNSHSERAFDTAQLIDMRNCGNHFRTKSKLNVFVLWIVNKLHERARNSSLVWSTSISYLTNQRQTFLLLTPDFGFIEMMFVQWNTMIS